jgi:nucleotide exchange factor SIL1
MKSWCHGGVVVAAIWLLSNRRAAFVSAAEIQPEPGIWMPIGENDTIPAGMHVRMDMTTGEKWVKPIEDEEDDSYNAVEKNDDAPAAATSVQLVMDGSEGGDTTSTKISKEAPQYDYDRMHATLAQLPPEEHERMGGLPELPPSSDGREGVAAVERKRFEARMKEIWETRQAELQQIQQEQMVDLPQVLKTQISYLQDYTNGMRSIASVTEDLTELEFLLSDVDMARDFHTLQGWPWLLSVLVGYPTHNHSNTTLSIAEIEAVQAAAAWVVGTAVQNTGEFHPWVVEPVQLPNQTIVTALDGLLHVWRYQVVPGQPGTPTPLAHKILYAISASVRGNPLAQQVLHRQGEPSGLALQALQNTPADTTQGRKQILRLLQLGQDLLEEWNHVQATDDANEVSRKVVQEYAQAWTTAEWCDLVLEKLRIVTQVEKRVPIMHAWFLSCGASWPDSRVLELLAVDDTAVEDDVRDMRDAMLKLATGTGG